MASNQRILSLDQFRGYTVAGMILVNYIGDFSCIHPVFSHHNTYFSYADSIMPSFHFAVGFALRLVLLKRLATDGAFQAYAKIVRRCLFLVLLSTVLELLEQAIDGHVGHYWKNCQEHGLWSTLAGPLKCEFWETLAIIGVTSLWVLPVIARGVSTRLFFMVGCAALHVVLSYWFYLDFMWARPNVLDTWWGAEGTKGLDGGPFGFLTWAMPQIVGSLAYDVVVQRREKALQWIGWSAAILMLVGYGLSCLTKFQASSPTETQSWQSLLAEPPFVAPSAESARQISYWVMSKRTVGLSFILFSSGFALAVYLLFFILGDRHGFQFRIFQTLGQNALAAYIIHEAIGRGMELFAAKDSSLPWVATTFVIYAALTYEAVRWLNRRGIFLRM
jgi:predicted acyltransferase